ncbi:MAG TPA: hypothetical protein VF812_02015 [Ktedonobacterales bacterium]
MNPSQHITTLRQTHRTATSLLPILTATLTVAGAVLAAMDSRAPQTSESHAETPLNGAGESAGAASGGSYRGVVAPRVTVRAYIATLVGRVLLVALGIALVLALVYAASASGSVGRAVMLTALILLALYLTEKIARRA